MALAREQKRRKLVAAAAVVVLMATIGLVISLLLINEQRSAAEANLAVAALNLKEAWAAVDDLSKTSDELAGVAGAEQSRQQLIRKALEYYQRLTQKGEESIPRADLALTYSRIGGLTEELQPTDAAIVHYVQAKQLYEQLDTRKLNLEEVREVRRQQANNLNALGLAYTKVGKQADATAVLQAALAIQNEIVGPDSGDREHRVDLGLTKNNFGFLLQKSGEINQAETVYREAIELLERASVEDKGDFRALRGLGAALNNLGSIQTAHDPRLAQVTLMKALDVQLPMISKSGKKLRAWLDVVATYINLGDALMKLEDWSGAEEANRSAAKISRQLATDAPKVSLYQRDLAVSLNNLGLALRSQNKLQDALAAFGESIQLQTSGLAEEPKNPSLASNLGSSLSNSAMISLAQKDFSKASDDFRRAVELHQVAVDAEPNNASYRQNLGKSLANLTQLLRQLKDSEGEMEILRQRQTLWKNDPVELQHVAEELATLVNRTPQLVDELVGTLKLCKSAGVDMQMPAESSCFSIPVPRICETD